MAFRVSYAAGSLGPAARGVVEDVPGSFSLVWAVVALGMVPQLILSLRLRAALARVGAQID